MRELCICNRHAIEDFIDFLATRIIAAVGGTEAIRPIMRNDHSECHRCPSQKSPISKPMAALNRPTSTSTWFKLILFFSRDFFDSLMVQIDSHSINCSTRALQPRNNFYLTHTTHANGCFFRKISHQRMFRTSKSHLAFRGVKKNRCRFMVYVAVDVHVSPSSEFVTFRPLFHISIILRWWNLFFPLWFHCLLCLHCTRS